MRHFKLVIASVGGLLFGTPAWANYVDVTYSGTILQVGSSAPNSLAVGTPIMFNVVFDTAKLVDYTAALNKSAGTTLYNSFSTASLSDDPLASLSITVGSITFSKTDQRNYGMSGGLAGGDVPYAEYINGSFGGVGNIFVNSQGYSLDADPVADAMIRLINNPNGSEFGLGGPQTGNFDFYLGLGTLSKPFGTGLALGNINLSTVQISAVPEPTSLGILIAGLGLMISVRVRRWIPLRHGLGRGCLLTHAK